MRQFARACIMATIGAMAAMATCPVGTTHIVDSLVAVDGSATVRGKITVRGPSVAISSGATVASTSVTIPIGAGGAVDFCLVGGPGYVYQATYSLTNAQGKGTDSWTERWVVPLIAGSPLVINRLWGGSSAPQFLVSPNQLNPAGYAVGQCPGWNGTAWVPTNCGGGGGITLSWAALTSPQWAALTSSQWAALTN